MARAAATPGGKVRGPQRGRVVKKQARRSRSRSRSRSRGGGVQKERTKEKKKPKVGRKIVAPVPAGGGRCSRDLKNILSDPVMRRDRVLKGLVQEEMRQASFYINEHHQND